LSHHIEFDGNTKIDCRLISLYKNLFDMEDNIAVSQSEWVVARNPWLILLPRFVAAEPVLPREELTAMANDIRQVAASLQFLHRELKDQSMDGGQHVNEFLLALRSLLTEIQGAFPMRPLLLDPESLRILEDVLTHVSKDRKDAMSSVLRFTAVDIQDLYRSC
jgi:hypothetical protein